MTPVWFMTYPSPHVFMVKLGVGSRMGSQRVRNVPAENVQGTPNVLLGKQVILTVAHVGPACFARLLAA